MTSSPSFLKPTKGQRPTAFSFDVPCFPKKLNYEYVDEYFNSKATNQDRAAASFNPGDILERSVEITNYLVKEKLINTSRRLEKTRNEFNDRRGSVRAKWKDLEDTENSLRDNFVKFDYFVRENEMKKQRAANKIVEQKQLTVERKQKTEELKKKLEQISVLKERMDKRIKQYRIFPDYLQNVAETEESFQAVNDILKRYEALTAARNDLNEIQQMNLLKLENAKNTLTKIIENFMKNVTTLTNQVIDLQNRYEAAKLQSIKWERLHKDVQILTTERMIQIVSIKGSCERMYWDICKRRDIKPIYIKNVENQLRMIREAIGQYEIINKNVEEMKEKALKDSIDANESDVSLH